MTTDSKYSEKKDWKFELENWTQVFMDAISFVGLFAQAFCVVKTDLSLLLGFLSRILQVVRDRLKQFL